MSQNEEKTPHIYAKKGLNVACDPGRYYACTCGHSSEQPFCDGSHEGTHLPPNGLKLASLEPITFAYVNTARECLFCDGTHSQLID